MKPEYINPNEGTWVLNDFRTMIGEKIVVDDLVFVIESAMIENNELTLRGSWPDEPSRMPRVWPNLQWVALNWGDDDG